MPVSSMSERFLFSFRSVLKNAQQKVERIVCSTNFSLDILTDIKHVLKFAQKFRTMKSNSTSVLVMISTNKTLLYLLEPVLLSVSGLFKT